MARVLIIDDDEMMCLLVARIVEKLGHEAVSASSVSEGLLLVGREEFDIVFLDVNLSDGNGLDMMSAIQESPGAPEVIIITAGGDPDGAEFAIKNGAWDYIDKASSWKRMALACSRALQYRERKRSRAPLANFNRVGIVGSSAQLVECLDLLAEAAGSSANVLVTGETGTGKELCARAIHLNSARAGRPFVVVDCASLPKTLAESELFGHVKGAFTGADRNKTGLIKQADGGTLFLDELGELPLSLQKTFLRVLEERSFRPVGAKDELKSDFRLVSATNRDLERMAEKGVFRSDLLFRLRSIIVALPPLRERKGDVKELALHFADRYCQRYGIGMKTFSPDFLEALESYVWPGNVREFSHAMERAIASSRDEPTLFPKHLPTYIRVQVVRAAIGQDEPPLQPAGPMASAEPVEAGADGHSLPSLRRFREAREKEYLKELLTVSQGDIRQACRISGISRARLYALLKKHEFSRRW